MRAQLITAIVLLVASPASAGPLRTGKGPCESASDCRSGVCLAEGEDRYCSASCGDCPAGMRCDATLFAHLGMKVCRRGLARAAAPATPARLPCRRDADCEGALVCAEMFGHRECALPCRADEACAPPVLGGVRVDMMRCRIDQGDRTRRACLPREACLANPMACVTASDGRSGLDAMVGGVARMGRDLERSAERADPTLRRERAAAPAPRPRDRPRRPRPRPDRPRPAPAAMAPQAFERFLEQLEAAPFEDDRQALLRLTARRNHFSCAQLGRVIDVLAFEDDRMFATRALAPRLVDPENAHEVLGHFRFSDEREAAARVLERR